MRFTVYVQIKSTKYTNYKIFIILILHKLLNIDDFQIKWRYF